MANNENSLTTQPLLLIYQFFKLDGLLFTALVLLSLSGLMILYSASGGDMALVQRQAVRLAIGFFGLLVMAQIPADKLRAWSVMLYVAGLVLLLLVLVAGDSAKGAQRWLSLGLIRFQPSEVMKIWVPMMMAFYFSSRPIPPKLKDVVVGFVLLAIPAVLILKQPDLGTAILVTSSGLFVIFLAGLRIRMILSMIAIAIAATPIIWFKLHDYQRTRIMTLLNPESDPLNAGYHIIQSKIAIGSGGIYGKGWFNGTQSRLDFIPERSTDFIFSVFTEEFGLLGAVVLILTYFFIVVRGLMIAAQAQSNYAKLLGGGISLSFFSYVFVNIGMVTGLLPVVGVPLPLISYGGTSMVTLLTMFGILMSINSNKKLLEN